jgi:uncharacterized protein
MKEEKNEPSFKVRTVTCFLTLDPHLWKNGGDNGNGAGDGDGDEDVCLERFAAAITTLREIEQALRTAGYEVQTVRIATNSFSEWLFDDDGGGNNKDLETIRHRLRGIDSLLTSREVFACALGPAQTIQDLDVCREIVRASPRFSCSASLRATDATMAMAAAQCVLDLASENPLSNFCFCVASANTRPFVPFFPAAKSASRHQTKASLGESSDAPASGMVGFAVGLENGELLGRLLKVAGSIQNLQVVETGLVRELEPLVQVCQHAARSCGTSFIGIDTSLNPSLDRAGSVAAALENLEEVPVFGGPGTVAAAAALTTILQRLPLPLTGYCGLMLPLCEDVRLAELASNGALRISDLLSISHVCGVGVDTVPVPGDVDRRALAGLLLDVAGVAERWDKSLSCRVFPVPGKHPGDLTTFDFPHLVNSKVLPL